jgi:hypothetical protein
MFAAYEKCLCLERNVCGLKRKNGAKKGKNQKSKTKEKQLNNHKFQRSEIRMKLIIEIME